MKGCIYCNGKHVEFDHTTQQYDCGDCGESFALEEILLISFKSSNKGKQKTKRMKREY